MMSAEAVKDYFGSEFLTDIKSTIADYVNKSDNEILGINSRQREISNAVTPILQEAIGKYGLELLKFSISGLDINDNELCSRYDNIGIDAYAKLRNAQADRGVMDMLGSNWQAQQ